MLHIEYYKDGTPCECDEMKRFYYESGILEWETPYVNGKVHGTERVYNGSGTLQSMIPYVNDRKHGMQKQFLSGALCDETLWIKGFYSNHPAENFV